ncbi:MAG TPA: dihydrodipicolinate reductase C-terminal domain-containing protein, partial [Flavisolibacter sp.]|nr:dihydrodipicolinate reductase C-terminal domain-containing protein [Flavisolibacter sp.]
MKIALIGYGKMGKMIEEIAIERGHEMVLKISSNNVHDFTNANLNEADVAIEFTTPDTAFDNIKKCIDYQTPVVSGSTGWNERLAELKEYCNTNNGSFLHASNFSVGVNIFFEVNKYLAKLMSSHPEYNVTLKEIHHTQKKDAPSGTAVTLAEQVLSNISRKKEWVNDATTDPEKLAIFSERIDPAPGTHHVKYTSEIDDIEII